MIWRKSAENFSNFTRKGSLVGVEGHIQTRTYDNAQGQRVYVTEVVVENFALLESKATTQARPSEPATGNNQAQAGGFGQQPQSGFGGGQPQQRAPQTPNFGAPASSAASASQQKPAQSDNSADPFANNGKTIDISDDDLPF